MRGSPAGLATTLYLMQRNTPPAFCYVKAAYTVEYADLTTLRAKNPSRAGKDSIGKIGSASARLISSVRTRYEKFRSDPAAITADQ